MSQLSCVLSHIRPRMLAIALGCLLLAGCASEGYYRQGNEQFSAGQYEMAIQNYKKAVDADPSEVQYKTTYLRRRDEAIATLFNLAQTMRQQGKFAEVDAVYQRILGLSPNDPRVSVEQQSLAADKALASTIEKIQTLLKQGDKPRAMALLSLALKDAPTHPTLLALRREIQGENTARLQAPSLNLMNKKPVTLEFRNANVKMVFEVLARNTGINFILDRDVRGDLSTTIFVKKVPLEDAVDLILSTNKLDKKVLNSNTVLIYPSSPEKTAEYQDLVIKSFYLTNSDAKRTAEMLKGLLKVKNIYVDDKVNMLVLRESPETIELAGKLIAMQDLGDPEVMLEVEVLEVKRTRLTELGIQYPQKLTLSPLTGASDGNVVLSDLSGLNQKNTLVSGASLTLNLKRDTGDANVLANPRIRARNKEKASILIGDRLPIITTTTTSTGLVTESVQYQDVGLKLDVEPTVYLDNDVGIKIGMEVSTLGNEVRSSTGTVAYQIGTRNASTILRLKDGETQVLAGLINDEERKTASKVPGLGDIPLLGRLFASQKDDNQKTEIVLSITPHIVRSLRTPTAQDAELWSGTENYMRVKPMSLENGAAEKVTTTNSADTAPAATADDRDNSDTSQNGAEEDAPPSNDPVKASLYFEVPKKSLKVGESVDVTLNAKSDGGIRSLPMQLGFDPKKLQVSKVVEGKFFKQSDPNSVFSHTISANDGKVYLSLASTNIRGAKGQSSLLSFTLTALAAGDAEVKVLSANPIAANDVAPVFDSNERLQLGIQ